MNRKMTRDVLAAIGIPFLTATIALTFIHGYLVLQIVFFVIGLGCFLAARFMGWRWLR